MTASSAERASLLEAEIIRLEGELAILERQWNRKWRLIVFAVLAVPAYFLFGASIAVLIVLTIVVVLVLYGYLRRARWL